MVLPQKGLDLSKVWSKESGSMDQWSAGKIRGEFRDLVVITLYLKGGEGNVPDPWPGWEKFTTLLSLLLSHGS